MKVGSGIPSDFTALLTNTVTGCWITFIVAIFSAMPYFVVSVGVKVTFKSCPFPALSFVNAASGNFQLKGGSPAIDVAVEVYGSSDLAGNARKVGAKVDAGAYEYQSIQAEKPVVPEKPVVSEKPVVPENPVLPENPDVSEKDNKDSAYWNNYWKNYWKKRYSKR